MADFNELNLLLKFHPAGNLQPDRDPDFHPGVRHSLNSERHDIDSC